LNSKSFNIQSNS